MVEAPSNDETPWYTSSRESENDQLDPESDSGLILSGVLFDAIHEVAAGPNTVQEHVLTGLERLLAKVVDQLDPLMLLPKLLYKTISYFSSECKETIDYVANSARLPTKHRNEDTDMPVPEKRDQLLKSFFGY